MNFSKLYSDIIQSYTSNIKDAYVLVKNDFSKKKIFGIPLLEYSLNMASNLVDYDEKIIISAILYNPYEFNLDISKYPKDIRKICKDYYFFNFQKLLHDSSINPDDVKDILINTFYKPESVLLVFSEVITIMNFWKRIKNKKFKSRFLKIFEKSIVPLCIELGMYDFRDKLLTKFFSINHKKKFNDLNKFVNKKYPPKNLEIFKNNLISFLKSNNLKPDFYTYRYKNIGSFYEKAYMSRKVDINKIFDVYAIRLIYSTKKKCYNSLNLIKDNYQLYPKTKVSDYIKHPKPNGYQSIHMKILMDDYPFEVQIRTLEMDNSALYGVAAHFHYKNSLANIKNDKIISVLKEKNKSKIKDNAKMFDFITVVSSINEKYTIPKKSTLLDFAIIIHTDFAEHFDYALIDGKKVTAKNYLLKNYNKIKLFKTSKNTLKEDDLNNVFLTKNKRIIRQLLKKQNKKNDYMSFRL